MLKYFSIFLVILSFLSPSYAAIEQSELSTIVVNGQGIIKAAPDVAYIMLGVEETQKTAAKAQEAAASKMGAILNSLQQLNIPKDKIETTGFRLFPQYEYHDKKRQLAGYTASNQIKITLDKLDLTGKVIDTAINAGANNVNNINFSIKETASYKRKALQQAFNDAKQKAKAIAQTAALRLKRIRSIQESGAYVRPLTLPMSVMKAKSLGAEGIETPITPGDIEVYGNITIIYEFTP